MRKLVFVFVASMVALSVCCTGNKAPVIDTAEDSSEVVIDSISFFGVHIGDSLMSTVERLAEIRLLKDWDHDDAKTYPVDFGGERWDYAMFRFERDVLHSVTFFSDVKTKHEADSIFDGFNAALGKKYPISLPLADSLGNRSVAFGIEKSYSIWLVKMRDGDACTLVLEYSNDGLWSRLDKQSKEEI